MSQLSFLCIATFFKGHDFMRTCKELGHTVYLLTDQKLAQAEWPREAIDEFFYLPSPSNSPDDLERMLVGLAHAMRSRRIDRVVALDDFDVEKGALVRETFRIDGMGLTTSRYFRDKLAMRTRAAAAGIRVPAFSPLFHDETITNFLQTTEAPWLIKPRSEASATGIRKVHSLDEAWSVIHSLGDQRHQYLIEQFKPGRVYHVDSLSVEGRAVFSRASQYLATPMEVAHGGGVFRTTTLSGDAQETTALRQLNKRLGCATVPRTPNTFGAITTASCIFWKRLHAWVEHILPKWSKLHRALISGVSGPNSKRLLPVKNITYRLLSIPTTRA